MKKLLPLLAIVFAVSFTSCYRVQPDATQESVLVMKPYIFGHGGVDSDPVTSGATWCAATTDHVEFTITPRIFTESFNNLITHDNINVDFNAYITLQVTKGETPVLLEKFGDDSTWYKNNIQQTFRTLIRNGASDHTCFELASNRKILDSLSQVVKQEITEHVKNLGMPVTVIDVQIGAVTPPDDVLAETVHTAAQTQRILTQNATKLAEDARKAAEISKAEADKAYQNQMNMTIDQYLALRNIEIQKEKIQLIKDKANVSIIFGDVTPTLNVK